jgi:shikimate kinase
MPLEKHLILIGPMGAGKSTIGRLLSEQLLLEFLDLDKEIEDRSGASIPWIFDIEGEAGFRDRESTALSDILLQTPKIVATGGGCVLREDNRKQLAKLGTVIYLTASVEQQLARTARDKNRPLLQTDNPERTLIDMAQQRNPLYAETAHITVDTNGKPPKQVALEILQLI